ncbi:hypothetical protein GGE16_001690 [Rhizobium leguminosarum]|uniref:Uncharacterized protein n=1 Tax=Rhizobium leguminosarum TaxID=384 RepID=A0AAE2MIB1_RHILE|nr:hypothetical protein [Rhizobium leguminosarum]MBB4430751.1 hypothetical protein [Rhizobium esperanzae]MBB4296294.1 hypothetical protein [Rhizobium leguminosarum]MBB4308446.1 hypothetical protein [Rhizobium leguminosarum]MBB4416282.1 hypothetical protein [Rhizobium leguminosarum]
MIGSFTGLKTTARLRQKATGPTSAKPVDIREGCETETWWAAARCHMSVNDP